MQLLQWQTKGTNISRRCSVCCGCHFDGCRELFLEDDYLCFLNYTRKCSQQSSSSTMSQNSMPTFVYQRRRHREKPVAFFTNESSFGTRPSDACHSGICSEAPLFAAKEHVVSVSECATEGVRSPMVHPIENKKVATASSNGFHAGEEAGSEEALTTDVARNLNDCSANDNCSSSKSNLELRSAALKIATDDAGECSSSGALIAGRAPEEMSERDVCISILRSQGLLGKVWTRQVGASKENTGLRSNNYCLKSCKVCEHMESTKNMLMCDSCDDAFHTSCHNPRIKILPVSEWLCSSCLQKKRIILKDKSASSNLVNISTESGRNRYSASELELGSLEFMFRDTEPYMSNVRIGDEFQADVPDWGGVPINEFDDPPCFPYYIVCLLNNSSALVIDACNCYRECDLTGNPLEMDTSSNINMQDGNAIKTLKSITIGNWLQCREVIEGAGEGVDGTVCGKWRRAPLFEVQTDEWECFRCVLWDPSHADCAVPQELDTDEVMKQLKYVEMLRPRFAAKRRKMDSSSGTSSQDVSRL